MCKGYIFFFEILNNCAILKLILPNFALLLSCAIQTIIFIVISWKRWHLICHLFFNTVFVLAHFYASPAKKSMFKFGIWKLVNWRWERVLAKFGRIGHWNRFHMHRLLYLGCQNCIFATQTNSFRLCYHVIVTGNIWRHLFLILLLFGSALSFLILSVLLKL